ncbi:hypothetical protein [Parashewanella tropica]|uniref:hypothetical protein n=1 Tax=Parashewanella tropica TaxID=2547970 RepID=UPI001478C312|nr:hypothetical protein [Parashewanella tropica]
MSSEPFAITSVSLSPEVVSDPQQRLFEAVKKGKFNQVNSLILMYKGLSADIIYDGLPLIYIAAKGADMHIVEVLLTRCQRPNFIDMQGKNLLHHLFTNTHFSQVTDVDLVVGAMNKGADLFQVDDEDMIPLIFLLDKRYDQNVYRKVQYPNYRQAVKPFITPKLLDDARVKHEPLLVHLAQNISDFSEQAYLWLFGLGISLDAYTLDFESVVSILQKDVDQAFTRYILQLFEHERKFPHYLDEYEIVQLPKETHPDEDLKSSPQSSHLSPYTSVQVYVAPEQYAPYSGDPLKEEKMRQDADPTQWDAIFSPQSPNDDLAALTRPLTRRLSRSTNDLHLSQKKEKEHSDLVVTHKPKLQKEPRSCVSRDVLMVRVRFAKLIEKLKPHNIPEDKLELIAHRAPIAQSYLPGAMLDETYVRYIPVRYKPVSRSIQTTNKPKDEDRKQRQEFLKKTNVYRRASILRHEKRRASMRTLLPSPSLSPNSTLSSCFTDRRSSIFSFDEDSLNSHRPLVMLPDSLTRTLSIDEAQQEATTPLGKTLDKIHQLEEDHSHLNVLVPAFTQSSYQKLVEPTPEASATLAEIRSATKDLKDREHVSGQYSEIVNNLSLRFEQYDFEICAGEQPAIAFHSLELVGELLAFYEAWREMTQGKEIFGVLRATTNAFAAVSGLASIATEIATHFSSDHHVLGIVSKCATSFSNIQTALSQLLDIFKRLKESNLIEDIEHHQFDINSVTSYLTKGLAFARTITFTAKSLASAANKILEVLKQVSSVSTVIPILGIIVSVFDMVGRIVATGQHIRCFCDMAEIKACLKLDFPDSEALCEVITENGKTDSKVLKWLAFKAEAERDDVLPNDIFDAKRYYLARGFKRINQKRIIREVIGISFDILQISSDILKLTGVASEVGLGLSATTAALKTTQLTTRAGKQLFHDCLKDDKSKDSKHEARCYQIQVLTELLETVALGYEKGLTEDDLYKAQICELKLMFRAAGMRLDKFLDSRKPLKDRIQSLYQAIKQREGLSF